MLYILAHGIGNGVNWYWKQRQNGLNMEITAKIVITYNKIKENDNWSAYHSYLRDIMGDMASGLLLVKMDMKAYCRNG